MIEFRIEYTIDEEKGCDYNGHPEYHTSVYRLSAPTILELYEEMARVKINNNCPHIDVEFDTNIEEIDTIGIHLFDENNIVTTNTFQLHTEKQQLAQFQELEHKEATQQILDKLTEQKERLLYDQLKIKFEPLEAEFQKVLDDNYWKLLDQTDEINWD